MIEICAIVKNENDYLDEWVNYHLNKVDRIVIYDNGSITKWVTNNSKVILKEWLEKYGQLNCYQTHARETDADWTAFIDIDEFLIGDIRELIDKNNDYDAIQMRWVRIGADGQVKKEIGGVMERFKTPTPCQDANYGFKIIAKPKKIKRFINPHDVLVEGKKIITREIIINHYFTKSYEEWCKKRDRGRVDCSIIATDGEFFTHNPDMINKI
jgi:hypothetical protein